MFGKFKMQKLVLDMDLNLVITWSADVLAHN